MSGTAQYPNRDTCKRLHRRPSLDNHPGYPGPADPPTGTPKNGRRTARPRNIANNQQLATPPDTQQDNDYDVSDKNSQRSREASPGTPTPGEHLVTPASATRILPAHSLLQDFLAPDDPNKVDASAESEDEWTDITSQTSPTPAAVPVPPRDPSGILVPRTPIVMNVHPRQGLAVQPGSPAASILVPETIRDDTPALADHHLTATAQHNNYSPASLHNSSEQEHTEIELLRIRRAQMTETLNESTNLVNRLRARNTIQEIDLIRERAFATTATMERNAAVAGRDRAVAEAAADSRAAAARNARSVWRLRVVLVVIVMAVLAYALWCHVNQAGYEYIKRADQKRFGIQ